MLALDEYGCTAPKPPVPTGKEELSVISMGTDASGETPFKPTTFQAYRTVLYWKAKWLFDAFVADPTGEKVIMPGVEGALFEPTYRTSAFSNIISLYARVPAGIKIS
jgi:hypothetical protein